MSGRDFTISRAGRVHDFDCNALTHDGPCECPLDERPTLPPRRRPRDVSSDELAIITRTATT